MKTKGENITSFLNCENTSLLAVGGIESENRPCQANLGKSRTKAKRGDDKLKKRFLTVAIRT